MTTVAGLTRGITGAPGPTSLGLPARRLLAWARRRKWPLIAAVASVVLGMVFTLEWIPLHHSGPWSQSWYVPGDIWGVFRASHYVGWGGYADIYDPGQVNSFPGILFLYAPVAMLSGALGLTESFPLTVPHPTAWLVLGPYSLIIGAVVLFALDSLADRLGVSKGRRVVLCFAEAAILWIVDVAWGHPEDSLALALAVWALLGLWSGHTKRAGWLFGFAILMQPLVLLALPLLFFQTGARDRARTLCRCAVPSALALFLPFVADWQSTKRSVIEQPFLLRFAHITPWTSWAPKVGTDAVAGGPGRAVTLIACVAIGWWSMRRRPGLAEMVWIVAVCLSLRTVFDSALASYYPWPPMALALVVAATRGRARFALTCVCAMGVTVAASSHGPWLVWWTEVVGGLVLTLALARPTPGVGSGTSAARPTPARDELEDRLPTPSEELRDLVASS